MDIYGIIGRSLAHSFSPRYFNNFFQNTGIAAQYLCFEIPKIQQLSAILDQYPQLKGFNVTIPYKEEILPFLDEIDPEAKKIGAVNCVKVDYLRGSRRLIGYNTDVYGFKQALLHFLSGQHCTKALILGNGGAAKAVRFVLNELHIGSLTVSRTPKNSNEIDYPAMPDYLAEYTLIINTTPLGTWPQIEDCPPIPYERLTPNHYLFDLVYHPEITTFIKKGREQGAHTCNGYQMLLKQAEKNIEIWIKKNNSLISQSF